MRKTTKELREERAAVAKKQRELLDKADAESRGLSAEEIAEDNRLETEFRKLTADIKDAELAERQDGELALRQASAMHDPSETGLRFHDARTGAEVRAFARGESIARSIAAQTGERADEIDVGRIVVSALTGRADQLTDAERRGMMGGIDTTGGYLLNPVTSGVVLDLARAKSVCVAAGAQTVPMTTSELRLAKLTGDPTATWRGEGVRVPASNPSFALTTLRPVTLAAIVPISIELAQDAPNAANIITQALTGALSTELDRACLLGTGATEPCGIKNYTGVNSVTAAGAPEVTCAKAREAILKIVTANYAGALGDLAWVSHPRTVADYDALADQNDNALALSPWVSAPKRFTTTAMSITEGAGGAESSDIIGDFSQMVIGVRSNINIRVLDSGSAIDGDGVTWNAADQLMKLVVAYLRADMCLLRPTWFSVISGIST